MLKVHVRNADHAGERRLGISNKQVIQACERELNADDAFRTRVGPSEVHLSQIVLPVVVGESAEVMGRRLAQVVRAQALHRLQQTEAELEDAAATVVAQNLQAVEAEAVTAQPAGGLRRFFGKALRLFKGKDKRTELRASREEERAIREIVERAAEAREACMLRFQDATGFTHADIQQMMADEGSYAVIDAVTDRIIENPRFATDFHLLEEDPRKFYEENGAAVVDRVLRRELAQRNGVSPEALKPKEIEAFAEQHGFLACNHLAGDWMSDVITTGTMMSGPHSGGYVWFGLRHLQAPAPTMFQRMSTTVGPAAWKMRNVLTNAINIAVPQKDVMGPGDALETGKDTLANRAAYKVKGAIQQTWATAMGLPAGAHDGPIRLLPKQVAYTPEERTAVLPSLAGGVNSGENRKRQLAFLAGVLGLGAAIKLWPLLFLL